MRHFVNICVINDSSANYFTVLKFVSHVSQLSLKWKISRCKSIAIFSCYCIRTTRGQPAPSGGAAPPGGPPAASGAAPLPGGPQAPSGGGTPTGGPPAASGAAAPLAGPPPAATQVKLEFPPEGQGWLRICDKGNTYYGAETSADCSSGFWFDPPISVGCVCGHGIWILSTGWCDQAYITVILKGGECLFIGENDIKFVRMVGSTGNAYGEYQFASSTGFEYVQSLTDGGNDPIYSYYHPSYGVILGAVKPSGSVIVGKDGRTCVDAKDRGTLVTFVYDRSMKEYVKRQGYALAKACSVEPDDIMEDDLHIYGYGYAAKAKAMDSLEKVTNMSTYFNNEAVCSKCVPSDSPGNSTVSYLPSWNPPGWSPNSWNRIGKSQSTGSVVPLRPNNVDFFESVEVNTTEYFQEVKCKDWAFAKGTQEETLREISEQTKRMISAHIGYSLRKIQTPVVNVSDYMQFQKSRQVLLNVCPETEVPADLLNGLIRMFRVALKESMMLYPHKHTGSEEENNQISEALDNCLADVKKHDHAMKFIYKNNSCPKEVCEIRQKTCRTFVTVNYTYVFNIWRIPKNLTSGLPCALQTNGTSYDLPLEVAWKTIMFTHYYCARHFRLYSIEHSLFEQKMESFFNRWMQYRWRNPGPSFEAYKFIFQMYDLEKFSLGLDRCVAASRAFSPYRKWIRRPSYVEFCGENVFTKNGMVQNMERLKYTKDGKTAVKSHFKQKAYCANVWHEPKSLFKMNPQSRGSSKECIKYEPDEWREGSEPNKPWTQGVGAKPSLLHEVLQTVMNG